MARFIQEGRSIDYRPQADVAPGAVVKIADNFYGVALRGIPAGQLGALRVEGVVEDAKAAGAIAFGALVFWDGTKFTATPASGTYAGRAIADHGDKLWVLLNCGNLGALDVTVPTPVAAPVATATDVTPTSSADVTVTGTYADDDDNIAAGINANRADVATLATNLNKVNDDIAALVAKLKEAEIFTA
jgi:predicted RecA/RadA family phage recombinase